MHTIYRTLTALTLIIAFVGEATAQNAASEYIRTISRDKAMKESLLGVLAVTADGDTLAEVNSQVRLIPASNTKLISTGLAINELGPDFRFETKIAVDGMIDGGILDGDVYIVGGGDPTIASGDSIAVSEERLFYEWMAILKGAGISRINGLIIGDGRYFDGPIENDSWQYQDIGTYYGAGGDGLCFYINQMDMSVAPGLSPGRPVSVKPKYPEVPWMEWSFNCRTGKEGTGDNLYLFTNDICPVGEVRGTFAVDRKPKTEHFSNKFGSLTCAYYFYKFLKRNGIESSGLGYADGNGALRTADLSRSPATISDAGRMAAHTDSLTTLGSSISPTIQKIARITNLRSDNFYAETLYRIVGKKRTGSADYDASKYAQRQALSKLGMTSGGAQIIDGSGLSRKNYISPDFFCRFLLAMKGSRYFDEYLGTLGRPGYSDYSERLKNESKVLKDRIYMKSGSMNGVRCFSGYILPSSGNPGDTIVFSIMTNNYTGSNSLISARIDRIIALLAEIN